MKKNKSNDRIPKDEMLLAEAIAAARSNGYEACTGLHRPATADKPAAVCAIGALALTCGWTPGNLKRDPYAITQRNKLRPARLQYQQVYVGNDREWDNTWDDRIDGGETLGYAYRQAMK